MTAAAADVAHSSGINNKHQLTTFMGKRQVHIQNTMLTKQNFNSNDYCRLAVSHNSPTVQNYQLHCLVRGILASKLDHYLREKNEKLELFK